MRPIVAKLTTILVLLVLLAPVAVGAQPAGKVSRVGVLGNKASDPTETHLWQAWRLGLRERGWVEGGNVLIEYRWAEGNFARLPELAADLVRLKVDLIVARSSIFVQAAKQATSSISIVFFVHSDPVGMGHVASLARPGRNITGLSQSFHDTEAKRLELLKAVVPGVKRVAVLWHTDTPSNPELVKVVEEGARTLRLQLQVVGVRTAAEVDSAFRSMARERAQAVLVISSAFVLAEQEHLTGLAMRHRLPTMFGQSEPVEAGGLMSDGADTADLYRRGAIYVDKILKGASPADLPVEQPTKFVTVLNRKTAKLLGLTIPATVLSRVDQIID